MGAKFLLLTLAATLCVVANFNLAAGAPAPDLDDVKDGLHKAADDTKNFFRRAKNTLSSTSEPDSPKLKPWEIALIVVAALIIGFVLFCCIGYCLCECVKELVCCICCCGRR